MSVDMEASKAAIDAAIMFAKNNNASMLFFRCDKGTLVFLENNIIPDNPEILPYLVSLSYNAANGEIDIAQISAQAKQHEASIKKLCIKA